MKKSVLFAFVAALAFSMIQISNVSASELTDDLLGKLDIQISAINQLGAELAANPDGRATVYASWEATFQQTQQLVDEILAQPEFADTEVEDLATQCLLAMVQLKQRYPINA